MSSKIVRLLVVIGIIGGIVSYLFYFNPQSVSLSWSSTTHWEAPLALIIVSVFLLGATFAGLFAAILAARHALHDWRVQQKIHAKEKHAQLIIAGREALALKNLPEAEHIFQKILNDDSRDVIARVLLATTLLQADKPEEALALLDAGRQNQTANREILLLAKEASVTLGNYTSAVDNLMLLLQLEPENASILESTVEHLLQIDRIEDALEYQRRLVRVSTEKSFSRHQEELARIELLVATKLHAADLRAHVEAVEEVLKRHKFFPPALAVLASLRLRENNPSAAFKLWKKAYEHSGRIDYLEAIASTSLRIDSPEQAIVNIQSALGGLGEAHKQYIDGRFFFLRLLIHLEMLEKAEDEQRALQQKLSPVFSVTQSREFSVISALILMKRGNARDAVSDLLNLTPQLNILQQVPLFENLRQQNKMAKLSEASSARIGLPGRTQPSPRLSTP